MNKKLDIGHIINGIDLDSIDKHPNILIAASFWEEERYRAAKVCYRFMREIDDLIDGRKSIDHAISCLEKQVLSDKVSRWIKCLDKYTADDPETRELINTIDTFRIPLLYFHNFAIAMQYDIDNNGFPTFQSFLDYAEGASVAPASIFVHLCCLKKENGNYISPPVDIRDVARPCALFSYLVHIIRDFRKDQHENLNYFATEILEENGLSATDLKQIAADAYIPDNFRNVIRFYKEKAEEYRKKTEQQIKDLEGVVNGRYMKSLEIIYKLYLSVFDRIDVDKGSFTKDELTSSNKEIMAMVLNS
jgi:phytoene synthase